LLGPHDNKKRMENVAAIANNFFLNVIISPTGFFYPPI